MTFLTHGDDDLLQIGDPRIVRASHVRFSNTEKKWFVYLRLPGGKELKIQRGFAKRSEAVAEEVKLCQPLLFSQPDLVDLMLKIASVTDVTGDDSSG